MFRLNVRCIYSIFRKKYATLNVSSVHSALVNSWHCECTGWSLAPSAGESYICVFNSLFMFRLQHS